MSRMFGKMLDHNQAMRLYQKGNTDAEIAEMCGVHRYTVQRWRLANGLLINGDENLNTEQCEGCIYWRSANGYKRETCFCHHLLDTGRRRVDIDGECQSGCKKGGDQYGEAAAEKSLCE